MQRNGAVLTIVCVLLCLAFNYTFPLHRDIKWHFMGTRGNHSQYCGLNRNTLLNRTRNMVNNIESALKRNKHTVQNLYHINLDKNNLSDKDLRHYEQLVMMKKYPYLDIKELDMKYSPSSNKNTRQSIKLEAGGFRSDSSLCDAGEDRINVEINNRGLSGFSIPLKLIRMENKLKSNDLKTDEPKTEPKIDLSRESSQADVLHSLKDDILAYKE